MPPLTTSSDKRALELGCYYDQAKVEKVIKFAHNWFRPQFITGEWQLLEWQTKVLQDLYGWRKADGTRRFSKYLFTCAKKNGKSLLGSIIAGFEFLFPEVPSPRVATFSTTQFSAAQVYDELFFSITRNPQLQKNGKSLITSNKNLKTLEYKPTNAKFKSCSNTAGSITGFNLSFALIDEMSFWREIDTKLWQEIEYSQIARGGNAQIVIMTTASNNQTNVYYDLYLKAKRIISGEEIDAYFGATIYEADKNSDYENDPEQWRKANPSMDISFTKEQFAIELKQAKSNSADWLNFKRRRLNLFCIGSDNTWLDLAEWDACKKIIPETELKAAPLYLGVDLAMSGISAITGIWTLENKSYFAKTWAWTPKKSVEDRRKMAKTTWESFGSDITYTDGDMIDTDLLLAHIVSLNKQYNLQKVNFDGWSAYVIAEKLGQQRINCVRTPPYARYLSEPMKELEKAIKQKQLFHDGGKYLRFNLSCMRTETDKNGQISPDRAKSMEALDSAYALILAFQIALQETTSPTRKPSIYNTREVSYI